MPNAFNASIHIHLVLLHHAPDGGHFAHALHAVQRVPHQEVLCAACFVQVPAAGDIALRIAPLQRVPEYLAECRGIRTQCGLHALRQHA